MTIFTNGKEWRMTMFKHGNEISPLFVLKREPLHLNNIMIRERPFRFPCAVGRARSILLLAIVFFFGVLLLLYIQPLKPVNIAIIQADTSLLKGHDSAMTIRDKKQSLNTKISDDVYISTGSDFRVLSSESSSNIDSSSPEQGSKRAISDVQLSFSGVESNIRSITTPTLETCVKRRNVAFLKVHKAGSTTVMNIFLRFAIQNNLNIVLPSRSSGSGFNYLGYGKTVFRQNIVPLPGNETYNILCNHVVYNKSAFQSIMPADTTYVGIIREPRSHFLSAGSYYGFFDHLQRYGKEHNYNSNTSIISEYLQSPTKFNTTPFYVHNRMSFDFGVPPTQFSNMDFLTKYIDELNNDFHLIMVMERFAESLVLMKRTLCWNTKDILYVPLNARGGKKKVNLTDTDLINLKTWNSADFKLYDHFIKVFDKHIAKVGSDFTDEVEQFKSTRVQVETFCYRILYKKIKSSLQVTFPATKWSPEIVININDCKLMTEQELPMMARLIKTAWTKYRHWEDENN